MTNINRRFFDELAAVIANWRGPEADVDDLIHDIAEVLDNNLTSFQKQHFLHRCGVAPALKLGSGTKVIPLHPLAEQQIQPAGWDSIEAGEESFAPPVTINSNNSETKEEEYGWVFDADGNERPMTKQEWDKQHARDIADGWVEEDK